MDGITPLPKGEADARYELARLAEILPRVGAHLRTLGVPDEPVKDCQAAALALKHRIAEAREASLMDVARRIPA